VKEEQVLDKDQAVDLGYGREEAIQDASCFEGREIGSASAPSSGSEGNNKEVEHHREASKVGTESND
jgi:hypothetical protein